MNRLRYITLTLLALGFSLNAAFAQPAIENGASNGAPEAVVSDEAGEGIDAVGLIFGHIGDAYEYHITEINGHPIAVYLPVIVRSQQRGWFCFSSKRVAHGQTYQGFFISQEEKYNGKVVELNAQGEMVRPFDLSVTKNVFALLLSSTILIIVFLCMANAYKKNPMGVPSKAQSMMEAVILYLDADIIRPALGDKSVRFAPYLLTVFFFILLNNLMGLIPIFPFGANLTGNISATLVLALFTYVMTNMFGTKTYWKDILWPEVPVFLKTPVFPLMQIIEFISTLTKPIALMIRLFANIFAGHMIILVLTSLIFIFTAVFHSAAVGGGTAVLSVLFSVFMYCLELLVAFIQAYVFTMLSAIFIGLAQVEHHEEAQPTASIPASNNN